MVMVMVGAGPFSVVLLAEVVLLVTEQVAGPPAVGVFLDGPSVVELVEVVVVVAADCWASVFF